MGIENFEKKLEVSPFEKDFADLKNRDRKEKKNIRDLFQENAKLSLMLANEGEVDMTDRQKTYYQKELGKLREEVKEIFQELRSATGFEILDELKGVKAADSHYKSIAA